jgi:hypothetical protein
MTTQPATEHAYLSTACLHLQHDYCSAKQRPDGTTKIPSSCKFCGTPCICACHQSANPAQ